jgi:general secretion pathway protein C
MNDAMQRRCATGAVLGLIALVAYFQALGISRLCAAKLAVSYEPRGDVPPLGAPHDDHTTSARAILDRNPFDSQAPRPLDRASVASDQTTEPATPVCRSLDATLIASFPAVSESSLAALSGKPGQKPTVVRIGETIEGKIVRLIEWNRVVLEADGAACQIQMFQSRTVLRAITEPPAMRLNRETIDKVLANPFEYLKGVRIVPEQQNGNVIGIRLVGIAPGSLLSTVGFENGDRLENVNGFEVGTPEQMMTAYARLKMTDHLTARVNRGGRTVNLDIDAR